MKKLNLTTKWVLERLPKRPKSANKGTFGKVFVIAGSKEYPGAAFLSCAACYRVGAGLVTLSTESEVKVIVSRKLPEVTFLSQDKIWEKIGEYDVFLLGPGIGQGSRMENFVKQAIGNNLPKTVIDGDGLNLLAKIERWDGKLGDQVILTPHPGEMSRLTGLTVRKIQSDRITVAQNYAAKWNKIVVLKGANTVIASPAGKVKISPFVNPILATAGTGDVLAGVIAGLLAQGLHSFDASCAGVYIHGLAGEILSKEIGRAGALASDLLPILPQVVKRIT